MLFPATFNADPTRLRPLVVVLSSRSQAVLTVMSELGISNMATEMDALVLPLSGKTAPSQSTNSWNGNLCCCWPTADLNISAVNTGTEQMTVTAHGLTNGAGPLLARASTTLPSPLVAGTSYWAIVVDANTLKLATSSANALAGTAIDLTTAGSGTIGLAPHDGAFVNLQVDAAIAAGWPIDPKQVQLVSQGGGGTAGSLAAVCHTPARWAAHFDFEGSGPISGDTTGGTDVACSLGGNAVHFRHGHGTLSNTQEPYNTVPGSTNAGMPNKCTSAIQTSLGTATMDQLAALNGCTPSTLTLTQSQHADLVSVGSPTNESDLYAYSGCPTNGSVELFVMNGEDHSVSPDATANFKTYLYSYLNSHRKP